VITVLESDVALALAKLINYAPRVTLQIVASLTDDSRGIIYDHYMFKMQATREREKMAKSLVFQAQV
jgi:hypothetical protein